MVPLQLSGIVNPNGTVQYKSSGVGSVTRLGPGHYHITFPPGTWTTIFTPVFTIIGTATVASDLLSVGPDGSGNLDVVFTQDTLFHFLTLQ